jgi:flagellar protein FliS
MENNIKAYKKATATVDGLRQIVMLYDIAIASLQQAKEYLEKKDIQESYNRIEKSYLIVSGLRDALDMDAGGELAKTLKDWYSALSLRIITINRTQDISLCDLCIENLKEMRGAWDEADIKVKQEEFDKARNVKADSPDSSEDDDENESISVNAASPYSASALQGLSLSI